MLIFNIDGDETKKTSVTVSDNVSPRIKTSMVHKGEHPKNHDESKSSSLLTQFKRPISVLTTKKRQDSPIQTHGGQGLKKKYTLEDNTTSPKNLQIQLKSSPNRSNSSKILQTAGEKLKTSQVEQEQSTQPKRNKSPNGAPICYELLLERKQSANSMQSSKVRL
jgi:hypothetical protein